MRGRFRGTRPEAPSGAETEGLGPKGEGIGQIMQQLGAGAISDIKPEQYAQFVAAVEALR